MSTERHDIDRRAERTESKRQPRSQDGQADIEMLTTAVGAQLPRKQRIISPVQRGGRDAASRTTLETALSRTQDDSRTPPSDQARRQGLGGRLGKQLFAAGRL